MNFFLKATLVLLIPEASLTSHVITSIINSQWSALNEYDCRNKLNFMVVRKKILSHNPTIPMPKNPWGTAPVNKSKCKTVIRFKLQEFTLYLFVSTANLGWTKAPHKYNFFKTNLTNSHLSVRTDNPTALSWHTIVRIPQFKTHQWDTIVLDSFYEAVNKKQIKLILGNKSQQQLAKAPYFLPRKMHRLSFSKMSSTLVQTSFTIFHEVSLSSHPREIKQLPFDRGGTAEIEGIHDMMFRDEFWLRPTATILFSVSVLVGMQTQGKQHILKSRVWVKKTGWNNSVPHYQSLTPILSAN